MPVKLVHFEFAGLLAAQLLMLLGGCSQAQATKSDVDVQASAAPSPAHAEVDPKAIAAFNASIKKEPKVIDFVYDPAAVYQWTIGVKDDGSPRFGYAEYFCNGMLEHGLPLDQARVRIVDYRKFMAAEGDARSASLGSVNCRTGEHAIP